MRTGHVRGRETCRVSAASVEQISSEKRMKRGVGGGVASSGDESWGMNMVEGLSRGEGVGEEGLLPSLALDDSLEEDLQWCSNGEGVMEACELGELAREQVEGGMEGCGAEGGDTRSSSASNVGLDAVGAAHGGVGGQEGAFSRGASVPPNTRASSALCSSVPPVVSTVGFGGSMGRSYPSLGMMSGGRGGGVEGDVGSAWSAAPGGGLWSRAGSMGRGGGGAWDGGCENVGSRERASSGGNLSPEERRQEKNARERLRRRELSVRYEELSTLLNLSGVGRNVDKASVLRSAVASLRGLRAALACMVHRNPAVLSELPEDVVQVVGEELCSSGLSEEVVSWWIRSKGAGPGGEGMIGYGSA